MDLDTVTKETVFKERIGRSFVGIGFLVFLDLDWFFFGLDSNDLVFRIWTSVFSGNWIFWTIF